nr:zinc finger, CCHC-type [Tanacetum cinerariifolium]
MTTLVENNSVFRSYFEKQKFTGPNFIDWYRQLRLVLSTEDKKNYLEHPIPKALVAPPGQQVLPTAEEDQSVSSYVPKMKSYIENLECLGQPVSQNLVKNKPYKAAKGGHGKGKSKMGYVPNNVPFAPKSKTPPPPKKHNPAKDAICHQCGYGTHICITTQGLRGSKKLKPCALSLYVSDGHCATVEAIGTYHLELPSGLVIVLNNCHYAPFITR